jgi:hypothetical protein
VPDLEATQPDRWGFTSRRYRQTHLIAARLLVGAVMAQLALGVIALPVHSWTGPVVGLLSLIVAVTGVRGRFTSSTVGLSVASVVLVGLQGGFIALSDAVPAFGIVHLIDGLIIFGIAIVVAIESEDEGRAEISEPPVTP